jgi:hypothetical protein
MGRSFLSARTREPLAIRVRRTPLEREGTPCPAGDQVRAGIAASQQGFEATFLDVLNARARRHGH